MAMRVAAVAIPVAALVAQMAAAVVAVALILQVRSSRQPLVPKSGMERSYSHGSDSTTLLACEVLTLAL